MYRCEDCRREFRKPSVVSEYYPYGGGYVSEQIRVCPYCGGSYERLIECPVCGECVAESETVTNEYDEVVCENCGDELMRELSRAAYLEVL